LEREKRKNLQKEGKKGVVAPRSLVKKGIKEGGFGVSQKQSSPSGAYWERVIAKKKERFRSHNGLKEGQKKREKKRSWTGKSVWLAKNAPRGSCRADGDMGRGGETKILDGLTRFVLGAGKNCEKETKEKSDYESR